jgi:hypothetical protein
VALYPSSSAGDTGSKRNVALLAEHGFFGVDATANVGDR